MESGLVNPKIAAYSGDSHGRNKAANIMMPEIMATLPCTRISAADFV